MSIITILVSIMSIGALHDLPRPTTALYIFSSLSFSGRLEDFAKHALLH